jgi:hypothetical protein
MIKDEDSQVQKTERSRFSLKMRPEDHKIIE